MLAGLETLIALERFGTMTEAATRLRLTQSAVSKRLQALQATLGFAVVEPEGRRVRLTRQAASLLERARPILADLRALTSPIPGASTSSFSLALADSIASSWGPHVVSRALRGLDGVSVQLHAHRSILLVESVRLGRYHVGLSTDVPGAKDLIRYPVIDEPLVVVNSALRRKPVSGAPLISIEPSSATWRAIAPLLERHHPRLAAGPVVPVESFGATLQMVKAGFGDGLMPRGLVIESHLDRRCYRELAGVKRRVCILTRKTVDQMEGFQRLRDRLIREAARYFATS